MAPSPSQTAAERILASLSAGRAAMAQLGAAYLSFDQQVALHGALGGDTGRIAEMESMVDRRVDVLRARLRHPPRALSADGERVDDEPTPRGAAHAPATTSRVQRALGRADFVKRAESPPALAVEVRAVEPVAQPSPEPAAVTPADAPLAPGATPVVDEPALATDAPGAEPAVSEAPAAAEPVVAEPASSPVEPPQVELEPDEPAAGAVVDAGPPAAAAEPEAPAAPSAPRRATPRAAPALRVVAAGHADEPEENAPLATEPFAAVTPTGVRATGPSLDDEPIGGDDDDDDLEGVGVSAPGGGIMLGFGARRPAPPPRADSGAPRLTEEEEPQTLPMAEQPSIKPAGDDARIAALVDEAFSAAGRGDLNRAIQAFADVLDLRHDRADAHIGRGRCYLELGDYSSAMSDFQRAEDLQPERPDAHVAMGDLYFARKEYRRAIEFYDQAVELDGSHAMARCRRGISHYYRKNYRQAFQDLQRAYSLDPDIPNIRKYVQMAVKKMERPE